MWSDRRFNDFSTFGRAEKVSVFKGFRLFSKILRRERWLSPERSALPAEPHPVVTFWFSPQTFYHHLYVLSSVLIEKGIKVLYARNRPLFEQLKIKRNFFIFPIDLQKSLCYNCICASGCGSAGRAPPWGGGGRTFKSCHSDQRTVERLSFLLSCDRHHSQEGWGEQVKTVEYRFYAVIPHKARSFRSNLRLRRKTTMRLRRATHAFIVSLRPVGSADSQCRC